ncbi:UDP-N-acetylmuramate:L-alanyl-gamma-D-glutamyl-meso-diaminopimelate ligase [Neisseria sp. Ec49-e6-T10]|uniref:UDP-N-acetylmuramate:L-alanyl-gamma-D-glutamyl- meso-diaminopimelate ligase n=1 Tax=Neisseria sp. Ec49-e6-T10 TaxID=3140744 RepID=UPI003EC0B8DF
MKHIHIVGICGTFMGGIAAIAKEAGFKVTGCDANVYPPMSTQLENMGIQLIQGFDAKQTELKPDLFVIGNVVTRGNPLMEEILNQGLAYTSGPQWLFENVLKNLWVLAVAGTHGKTTTASMLAWVLEYAGLAPGFLIGGIPQNFSVSARMPQRPVQDNNSISPFFVIEADEYDTAFFDKRSKFVHYHPRTAILNNLEFDHADIFPDLAAIQTQFHHLIRTIPEQGLIISNGSEQNLTDTLAKGVWTAVEQFGVKNGWQAKLLDNDAFEVYLDSCLVGTVHWSLLGEHNRNNALAAIAAARHIGIEPTLACEALSVFKNVKRRMEIKGQVNGATIYDDFAHHPTAIATTIAGLRAKVGQQKIIAVLEPRSNTMKLGSMKDALASSLQEADQVICYAGAVDWNVVDALLPLQEKATVFQDFDEMLIYIKTIMNQNDHVLIMSNGGFQGIHDKLLK